MSAEKPASGPRSPDARTPYPLAMIACDAIYIDPQSGKRALVGCFSRISVASFPAALPSFAVYAAVSEWVGVRKLILQMMNMLEGNEPSFRWEAELESDDPLAVIETDFRIRNAVVPAPGVYRLQLYTDDAPLMERLLVIEAISPQPNR